MSYIQNPIVYLFDTLESKSGISFANFMTNEVPQEDFHKQPFMEQYQKLNTTNNNPQLYKYIYDPNLEFNFRFHQRISSIQYAQKGAPWVTIMFNTKQEKPLTNALSLTYDSPVTTSQGYIPMRTRRVCVPVNMVFISNDIDYLYTMLDNLSYYWDRIVNFPYQQSLQYSSGDIETFPQKGMALNIVPQNLEKLDTERRGSLVTAGYTFDLMYFTHLFSDLSQGNMLKTIDLRILVMNDITNLNFNPQILK